MNQSGKSVLFVDEIHRFNKAQQDALLPYVEDGTVVLIGATTENPFFEVNKALISRSTVFMLEPLKKEHISRIIDMALNDKERGLGNLPVRIDEDAREFLTDMAGGDARIALNALELAVMTTNMDKENQYHITMDVMVDCVQKKPVRFDKSSDQHYDNISAFIKSMRAVTRMQLYFIWHEPCMPVRTRSFWQGG